MATYNDKREYQIRPQATAGTDQTTILGRTQFAGVLSAAELVPNAALTGDATNNRIFTLQNKGQAGAGSTAMATLTTTASQVVGTPFSLTLSGTPANLVVAQGDILALVETHGGTGVAQGGYLATVTIARTDQP